MAIRIKNIKVRGCICSRCELSWNARVLNPAQCPYCKSYRWNEPRIYKKKGDANESGNRKA